MGVNLVWDIVLIDAKIYIECIYKGYKNDNTKN